MPKRILLPLALFLAACGQKGPLYLPQDAAAPAQAATSAAIAPAPASPDIADEAAQNQDEKQPLSTGVDTGETADEAEPILEK